MRQVESTARVLPGQGIGGENPRRAATFGGEGIEAVPAADIEDALPSQVGQLQAFEDRRSVPCAGRDDPLSQVDLVHPLNLRDGVFQFGASHGCAQGPICRLTILARSASIVTINGSLVRTRGTAVNSISPRTAVPDGALSRRSAISARASEPIATSSSFGLHAGRPSITVPLSVSATPLSWPSKYWTPYDALSWSRIPYQRARCGKSRANSACFRSAISSAVSILKSDGGIGARLAKSL